MINDPANPLRYKLPNPKINAGIDLPKSVYLCRGCSAEYERWVLSNNKNKWIMTLYCDKCRGE